MTKQYVALGRKLLDEGVWVENERTKSKCLTLIDETLTYDVGKGEFPLCTTRKSYYKQAIGEMLGYIRGYTSTKQFHELNVHTWDANAKNPEWAESTMGKFYIENGEDLGLIYGAIGNNWSTIRDNEGTEVISSFTDIVKSLKEGKDNRGLIWSFWDPSLFRLGCLRPCMYEHQFSLVNGKLYLSSTQR